MAELKASTAMKAFPTGTVVLREGAGSSRDMILLLQGNIGVFRGYRSSREEQVRVISQGSYHGERALFLGQQQGETLVALTDVLVMTITRYSVRDFLENHTDMALSFIEDICRRLAETSDTLERLQKAGSAQVQSRRSKLFPEGHGGYVLPLTNANTEYLYTTPVHCPMCSHTFESLAVLQSKLRTERTDPDLRTRYREIEPMYYDVETCPNCFFSALSSMFGEAPKRFADEINQVVGPYKLEMYVRTGLERDTFTVFASHYLALLCAPIAFDKYHLITANLWLRLSRLYQDCNEERLCLYACEKALDDYHYAYENLDFSETQIQRMCYLMGDLHFRKGEIDQAREFFFLAKRSTGGTKVIARQADTRLEEIREIKRAERARNAQS